MKNKLTRISTILTGMGYNNTELNERLINEEVKKLNIHHSDQLFLENYVSHIQQGWTSKNFNHFAALVLSQVDPHSYAKQTSLTLFFIFDAILNQTKKSYDFIENHQALLDDNEMFKIICQAPIYTDGTKLLGHLKEQRDFNTIPDFLNFLSFCISVITAHNAHNALNFFLKSYPDKMKEVINKREPGHAFMQDTNAARSYFTATIRSGSLKALNYLYANYLEEFNKIMSADYLNEAIAHNQTEVFQFFMDKQVDCLDKINFNIEIIQVIQSGNLELLKLLIQNEEKHSKPVDAKALFNAAITGLQFPIFFYLKNQYPNKLEELNETYDSLLEKKLEELSQLELPNEALSEKRTELFNYLYQQNTISKAERYFIANATVHLLKNDNKITPEQYKNLAKMVEKQSNPLMKGLGIAMMFLGGLVTAAGIVIQSGNLELLKLLIQNEERQSKSVDANALFNAAITGLQFPIFYYLKNQYPNKLEELNETYDSLLEKKLKELSQLELPDEALSEKRTELFNYLYQLRDKNTISKAELYFIANATVHLLKNDNKITPEQYKNLAKKVEKQSNPLMKGLGIAMMILGGLVTAAGIAVGATLVGAKLGVMIGVGGLALGAIGACFFARGKEQGLARRITELSETRDKVMENQLTT